MKYDVISADCHVDLIWPLCNLFDFAPDGRGEKWFPKLSNR